MPLRTLFSQEMIKNGILMPWITLCYRHGPQELKKTSNALKKVLPIIKKALNGNIKDYLVGEAIKPVFRRKN